VFLLQHPNSSKEVRDGPVEWVSRDPSTPCLSILYQLNLNVFVGVCWNEVFPWRNGLFFSMIWNVRVVEQYPFETSAPNSPIRLLK